MREALAGQPIDVVVQNAAGRRKRLFVADMDSTMIGQECIDELADLVGQKARVAAITERAMRGELAFAPALRERVALLGRIARTVTEDVIAQPHHPHARRPHPGRDHAGERRLHLPRLRRIYGLCRQDRCGTSGLMKRAPIDSSSMPAAASRATVAEPILGREAKLATLMALRARLGLTADETLAIGDGANDLDMIMAAGLGVAFHAKPAVAAAAAARIDHGDLTALLFAQGYRRGEFVE